MHNQSLDDYMVNYSPYCELDNPDNLPYVLESFILPSRIDDLHYHDGIELGYCSEGSGIFVIGKEIISFQSPCVSIIYPKQFHKAKSTGNKDSVWDFITFCPQMPVSHLHFFTPFLQSSEPNQSIFLKDELLFSMIQEIFLEIKNQEIGYFESISGILRSVLVKHSRFFEISSSKPIENSILSRIGPILNYISHHYKEDISIDKLASTFHISPATLRRWFAECMHSSPSQYLHKVRTTTASSLLLNTNRSVLEIALEVGYPSQSCFQRQFKQHYHYSPTQYKAKMQK